MRQVYAVQSTQRAAWLPLGVTRTTLVPVPDETTGLAETLAFLQFEHSEFVVVDFTIGAPEVGQFVERVGEMFAVIALPGALKAAETP